MIGTPIPEGATAADKTARTKAINQATGLVNAAIEEWAAAVELMVSLDRRLTDVRKINDVQMGCAQD